MSLTITLMFADVSEHSWQTRQYQIYSKCTNRNRTNRQLIGANRNTTVQSVRGLRGHRCYSFYCSLFVCLSIDTCLAWVQLCFYSVPYYSCHCY